MSGQGSPGETAMPRSTRYAVFQREGIGSPTGDGSNGRRRSARRGRQRQGTRSELYPVRSTREAALQGAVTSERQQVRAASGAASTARDLSPPSRPAGASDMDAKATCGRDVTFAVVNRLLQLSREDAERRRLAAAARSPRMLCNTLVMAETPRALARTLFANCSEREALVTLHAAADYAQSYGEDTVAARLRHAADSSDVNELSWRMLEQDVGVDDGAREALTLYAKAVLTAPELPRALSEQFEGRPAGTKPDAYAVADYISREAPWPEHLYESRPTHAAVLRALALAADEILIDDAVRRHELSGKMVLCSRLADVYASIVGPSGAGIESASSEPMPSKYAEQRARLVNDCARLILSTLGRFGKGIARTLGSDARAALRRRADELGSPDRDVTDDDVERAVLGSPEYAVVKGVWKKALPRLIASLYVRPDEEEPVYVAAMLKAADTSMDAYARDLLSSVREEDVERAAVTEAAMMSLPPPAHACWMKVAAAFDMLVTPGVYTQAEMQRSMEAARECVQAMRARGQVALAKQIMDSALLYSASKGGDPPADVRALSRAYGTIWLP